MEREEERHYTERKVKVHKGESKEDQKMTIEKLRKEPKEESGIEERNLE